MILPRHRTEPTHLPEQPLQHFGPAAQVCRNELAGLVGQIEQDGAGFEQRQRRTAVGRRVIDDRRNAVVGCNREEGGRELLAGADIDRNDPVRQPALFQKKRDLVAVRRGPVVQVDHGVASCVWGVGVRVAISAGLQPAAAARVENTAGRAAVARLRWVNR